METTLKQNLNIDKSKWILVKFGDVVYEPKETMKDIVTERIEHVVGLEHITTDDIHLRNSAGIEESTTFSKKFAKGDVLFGRRRAYLRKAAKAPFSGICSGDITVFRAKEELLPELLPFIVNNEKFFDYAIKHSAGGLSPRVKFKDLADYEFLLPPKDQQADLAELLWAMDDVIEKENEVFDKLEILRNSKEKEIFMSKAFKLDVEANDFFDKIADGTHDTPTKKSEGYKLLTSKNIKDNLLDFDTDYYISKEDYNAVNKRSKVDKNDILFGMIGTVGQVCRIKEEPDYAIKNMGLFKTTDETKSLVGFYYFKSRFFQNKLLSELSGTTQKYVSLSYLRSLKLPNSNNSYILSWIEREVEFEKNLNQIQSKIISSNILQKSIINQIF
jgi:type I restriction enzyme S subunit